MTAEQLGNMYGSHSSLTHYLNTIGKYKPMTKDEVKKYNDMLKDASTCKEAQEAFVVRNLRLPVSIAKKYTKDPVSMLDLIQEGNVGLVLASRKYNPETGNKFSTYATYFILGRMFKYLSDNASLQSIPDCIMRKVNKYNKLIYEASSEKMTDEELANKLKISIYELDTIKGLAVSADVQSLDIPCSDEDEDTLADKLVSENESVESIVENEERNRAIYEALNLLNDREKDIIIRHYGLYGTEPMTLQELGKLHHLTKERIRQIELSAMRKLKKNRFDLIQWAC